MTAPRMPIPRVYTRKQVVTLLATLVRDLRMDAYDARILVMEMGFDPIEMPDLAELLEERGYPNLARDLLDGRLSDPEGESS